MSNPFDPILANSKFREHLSKLSTSIEETGGWPTESWQAMCESGVPDWFLPEEFCGNPQSEMTKQFGYLELAAACLTTTFILTQRNAAVSRILNSDNQELKNRLSRELARNESFATVGISHLTTSRQHVKDPILKATPTNGGWLLNGEIPWTTGAEAAEVIVTGGVQPDGLQVLLALPTNLMGVEINPAPKLLALNESCTTSVSLKNVEVPKDMRLIGPCENVLAAGTAGGVTTSALALGAAQKSICGLETEAEKRPNLRDSATELRTTLDRLKESVRKMTTSSDTSPSAEEREALRKQSNSLVLRAAQAWLTASKGAGFLAGHPASRAVREAQFFLVWSCPQNVMAAALAEFACVSISSS
jgi:alkylation response protein AidB-like acyl-CoA dehydrogenase